MKFIITERQFELISNNQLIKSDLVSENLFDKLSVATKKYPCVPTGFAIAVQNLISKGYDRRLLKAALGIIGRESSYASGLRWNITAPLKSIGSLFSDTSVGPAQMKKSTAKSLGINADIETVEGALIAAYTYLKKSLDLAKKTGYSDTSKSSNHPSQNSAALDMAIASYNLGMSKIQKYCKTSDPKIMKPCKDAGKMVSEQVNFDRVKIKNQPNLNTTHNKIKVYNKPVPNYLPNYKTTRWDGVNISTHGYVDEVSKRMKGFTCF